MSLSTAAVPATSASPAPVISPAIGEAIRQAESILCVSHVGPDGDAVGSLLGMGWILRKLGKDPILALQDAPDSDLAYLDGFSDIVGTNAIGQSYDLIICLDASSPDRMGTIFQPENHKEIQMIVIDHHVTNTYFGDINWVEPTCAATCQMLVYLADDLGVALQDEVVPPLLTGLVTDTLCFRTSNTDSRVLEAAMRLVANGGDLNHIVAQTMMRQPLNQIRLWGAVLPNVEIADGVIWATITKEQLKASGTRGNSTGGLANFLATVNEANIGATFIQVTDDGKPAVECSFRAKPGFNVSDVAFSFGGGGHPPAAGCTVPGTLEEAVPKIVAALQRANQDALKLQAQEQA